jgi:hypothetical protein
MLVSLPVSGAAPSVAGVVGFPDASADTSVTTLPLVFVLLSATLPPPPTSAASCSWIDRKNSGLRSVTAGIS